MYLLIIDVPLGHCCEGRVLHKSEEKETISFMRKRDID